MIVCEHTWQVSPVSTRQSRVTHQIYFRYNNRKLDKAYPRDFMQRGRVRVLLKREDGSYYNPDIVSHVDECREKTACQCSGFKCINTWGSYECSCSGDRFYMRRHDVCIIGDALGYKANNGSGFGKASLVANFGAHSALDQRRTLCRSILRQNHVGTNGSLQMHISTSEKSPPSKGQSFNTNTVQGNICKRKSTTLSSINGTTAKKCEVLDWRRNVVVTGRVRRDPNQTSCYGIPINKEEEVMVIVDIIHNGEAELYAPGSFADILSDVGIDGSIK